DLGAKAPDELRRRHPRHHQVDEDDVRRECASPRQGLDTAPRLPDHLEVGYALEQGADPLAHDRVIVHQQHAQRRVVHARGPRGTVAWTSVPVPGTELTSRAPPSAASRSLIEASPRPRPRRAPGVNPMPSSLTRRSTAPGCTVTRSCTSRARAWRSALATA